MASNANIRNLYRELLRNPANRNTMKVLADALEDAGHPEVACAYRWAADRGRWPFKRYGKGTDGLTHFSRTDLRPRQVYDWNVVLTVDNPLTRKVPEAAWLEKHLVRVIKNLSGRRYGGVHRAFILLARALEGICESA